MSRFYSIFPWAYLLLLLEQRISFELLIPAILLYRGLLNRRSPTGRYTFIVYLKYFELLLFM